MAAKIKVFFTDGSTYEYPVKDIIVAKRYAHSITNQGFRKPAAGPKWMADYYPVHKIDHVRVTDEDGSTSSVGREENVPLNETKK